MKKVLSTLNHVKPNSGQVYITINSTNYDAYRIAQDRMRWQNIARTKVMDGVTTPTFPGATTPTFPGVTIPTFPGVITPAFPGVTTPTLPSLVLLSTTREGKIITANQDIRDKSRY